MISSHLTSKPSPQHPRVDGPFVQDEFVVLRVTCFDYRGTEYLTADRDMARE